MPINVNRTLLKAKNLAKRGDFAAAAQLYRDILELFPQNKQAIKGLATSQPPGGPGDRPGLLPFEQQVMAVIDLFNSGDLSQALEQAQLLAIRHPDEPTIHNLIGAANTGLARPQQAIASLKKAIKLTPDYTEAHVNLAAAFNSLGNSKKAIESSKRAIRLDPADACAHYNLGNALRDAGSIETAVASYKTAIQLRPRYAEAYNNLGNTLIELGEEQEAFFCFSTAVQIKPDFAEAHNNLGNMLVEQERHKEAIVSFRSSLSHQPDCASAMAAMLHQQALICDWDALESAEASTPDLGVSGGAIYPFLLLSLEDCPARHRQRAELYAKSAVRSQALGNIVRPDAKPARIRIGYFSADFCNHATMYLMIRLFELHRSDTFTIHAFSYGTEQSDSMGMRLKDAVDSFHDVRHLDEQEIAELARAEGIDIAVDLKGYTDFSRSGIFHYKAAPIQINYLGYPGTLGMPEIDYLIADEVIIPEDQRMHYCENIIYLPGSYQVNDNARIISDAAITRAEAGLPDKGFVFCCFNNNYKIGPREFDIWMRLLLKVEGSVLWLIKSNEVAEENLRREAKRRNVDPDRIILAERIDLPAHLARHRLADLFLDTFNYNAHTTGSDSLWAGLPVITKLGQGFAARVGGSLLSAIGLSELITVSEREYEQLALELARDPQRLASIREKLDANRLTTPLFDTELFTRHLEDAYQRVYQRYLDGKTPDTILIQA